MNFEKLESEIICCPSQHFFCNLIMLTLIVNNFCISKELRSVFNNMWSPVGPICKLPTPFTVFIVASKHWYCFCTRFYTPINELNIVNIITLRAVINPFGFLSQKSIFPLTEIFNQCFITIIRMIICKEFKSNWSILIPITKAYLTRCHK